MFSPILVFQEPHVQGEFGTGLNAFHSLLLFSECLLSSKANKCAAEKHCPVCLLGLTAESLHDQGP